MKSKILTWTGVILACSLAIGFISFFFIPYRSYIIAVLCSGIVVAVVFLLRTWWMYATQLIKKLDPDKRIPSSFWSMEIMDSLSLQLDLMNRTFRLAASGISELGHKQKSTVMDDVLKNDVLGKAILTVRTEMEVLRQEEERQNWIAEGLARFSEILRNKLELNQYADQILSHLIKYMRVNQGALFIEYTSEEGARYLEMVSCYAYDRKKFLEKRIVEGQGLVGQCMCEKELIFITDVPVDFASITSGLGHATPRNVVIAPLLVRDKFYGAIELASFEVLKPHQLAFLKKVSENIASEISSIQSLEHTRKLLAESKILTDELQQQEEEMRQNVEELMATQEQMSRKQVELDSYIAAINNTIASAEFDLSGKFVSANEIFLKVLGYNQRDLANQPYQKIMADDTSMHMMWENLKLGKFFSGEFKLRNKQGKELWLNGTFNPITSGSGLPDKVMMFAQFNTQEKERINELQNMVNALKSTFPVVEFSENFSCKTASEKFMKMFDLSRIALKDKTIDDFIDPYFKGDLMRLKPEILAKECTSILLPLNLKGNIVTYEASIAVGNNLQGETTRIVLVLIKPVKEKAQLLRAV